MKKLFFSLIALSMFASCGHDEEDARSESKQWFSDHYNYPIYINIDRDGLESSRVCTDITQCGSISNRTHYAGIAKDLIEDQELYVDVLESHQKRYGFPSEKMVCYLHFIDTFMCVEITPENNIIVIK